MNPRPVPLSAVTPEGAARLVTEAAKSAQEATRRRPAVALFVWAFVVLALGLFAIAKFAAAEGAPRVVGRDDVMTRGDLRDELAPLRDDIKTLNARIDLLLRDLAVKPR